MAFTETDQPMFQQHSVIRIITFQRFNEIRHGCIKGYGKACLATDDELERVANLLAAGELNFEDFLCWVLSHMDPPAE